MDGIRLLMCAATTRGGAMDAAHAFIARYPRSVSVSMVRASLDDGTLERKAIGPVDTVTGAALLPPALVSALSDRMVATAVTGKNSGAHERAAGHGDSHRDGSADHCPGPRKTRRRGVTTLALGSLTLQPFKGAGIVTLTDELAKLTGGGAERVISRRLIDASTRFVDREFLDPAKAPVALTSPGSIHGVTPIASTGTIAGDVRALVGAFFTARPQALSPVFVTSPPIAAQMAGSLA